MISVKAPARLHLGFLDLNGEMGRRFGSIGLAINSHFTHIQAQFSEQAYFNGVPAHLQEKVQSIVSRFEQVFVDQIKDKRALSLTLVEHIPEHAGLGSGTQLALVVGTVLSRLYQLSLDTPTIAAALDRGARSGIGIAAFDQGGFIIDGGLGSDSITPPMLARYDYPNSWRIVLILEHRQQGLHGSSETQAFTDLPEFPRQHAEKICHLSLMQLLPALIERNLTVFGHSITEIQALIGDHFSPAQGGRYTSPVVAQLLEQAVALGHTGIAQSSWGPTGCVFVKDDATAQQLANVLEQTIAQQFSKDDYSILITEANASGASIELLGV